MSRTLPRLVLASASPRRRDLLARLGLEFEVRPTACDETPRPGEAPGALVVRLADEKARAALALAAAPADEVALGADTVVVLGDEILGKPADRDKALRMLRALSGESHDVWTGIALRASARDGEPTREMQRACRTRVSFRALTNDEIERYVDSGEPADKAGAYAIQGGAAGFVSALDGEISTVVGLPLPDVAELLSELGFSPRPPADDASGRSR